MGEPIEDDQDNLVFSDKFSTYLGKFHTTFSTVNFLVDMGIGRFLKLSDFDAHLLTSGQMFGPKARLLANLVSKSDHPNKAQILGALNKLRGNSKREVIAHGYIQGDAQYVYFLERINSGELTVRRHGFTFLEFLEHCAEFLTQTLALANALDYSKEETVAFGHALDSLLPKSTTSPQSPADKAS
jgi:hypothetical protein